MNWVAYNFAHDVALPGSDGKPLGFLMYPQAETAEGRLDSLDPDSFKYEITSRNLHRENRLTLFCTAAQLTCNPGIRMIPSSLAGTSRGDAYV